MTLDEAQKNLSAWRTAHYNVAVLGQSYRINDRQYTSASIAEINRQVAYWESVVAQLQGRRRRGVRMQTIIPVDL